MKKAGGNMPFYSVIIPAYNCEKYLSDAVESVRQEEITKLHMEEKQ